MVSMRNNVPHPKRFHSDKIIVVAKLVRHRYK